MARVGVLCPMQRLPTRTALVTYFVGALVEDHGQKGDRHVAVVVPGDEVVGDRGHIAHFRHLHQGWRFEWGAVKMHQRIRTLLQAPGPLWLPQFPLLSYTLLSSPSSLRPLDTFHTSP